MSSLSPATSPIFEPEPEPRQPVVLLVEDDAGDALIVEELVADSRAGMTLHWVRSLEDAKAFLATEEPDCVLLDLNLPDSRGLNVLTTLQKWARDIAVVVLTGLAEESSGLEAMAAGAQDYLVKGRVDAPWLERAVRYAIQRKQSEQAAVALNASRLQAQENARLERGLLPKPLLAPDSGLEVVSRYHPGRAQALLGGDFYDVVQAADGTVHVLIGDVAGHGPDEAALGVALRIAWRTLVLSGVEGIERLRWLERILIAERVEERIFATLSCVTLLPDRRRVQVARAGHPGMLVRTEGRVEWAELPGGPPVGAVSHPEWTVSELTFPDDRWALVLFTDGLFEGRINAVRDRLGEEGLLRLARGVVHANAEEFVEALIDRAQELSEGYGGIDDDVAVLHVAWSPES